MKWLLLASIVMLSSCRIQRRIYSPLPINNPSLQEQNDFSVNATVSDPKSFDLNGGYAITNRLAVIAGLYSQKNKDVELQSGFSTNYDSSNLLYRHNGFTLGAGFYFPISGPGSNYYISFFGGINKGSFKMNEELFALSPNPPPPARINIYKSRLNRSFLQGSLNHYGRAVEASASLRYNLVTYKNIQTDYTDAQLADYRLPPFVSQRVTHFIDFSLETRIFFSQDVRWGLQLFTVVSNMMNDNDDPNGISSYDYYPFRIGAGIFFRGLSGKNSSK